MKPVSALLRGLDKTTQGANVAGALLIVGLVLVICVDVVGREAFGAPLPGVPEIVSLSIVAIVFLQVPQALRADRLTRSDALILTLHRRHPKLAGLLESLYEALGFLVVSAILYAHWPIFWRAYERSEFVGAVGNFTLPTWPAKLMILIGASLLALQFLSRILRRHFGGEAS